MGSRKLRIENIFPLWDSFEVPSVVVRRFNLETDYADNAWGNEDGSRYPYMTSNGPRNTAWHLSGDVITKTREAYSLFSMHAYLTENGASYRNPHIFELGRLVRDALFKIDPRPGSYWNINTRRVLPSIPNEHSYERRIKEGAPWEDAIAAAAQTWKEIAEKLVIVRIPSFMEPDEEDFHQWQEHFRRKSEEQERAEYERLKQKFSE